MPHLTAAVAFNIPLVLLLGVTVGSIAVSIAAVAVVMFAFVVVVVSFRLFRPSSQRLRSMLVSLLLRIISVGVHLNDDSLVKGALVRVGLASANPLTDPLIEALYKVESHSKIIRYIGQLALELSHLEGVVGDSILALL